MQSCRTVICSHHCHPLVLYLGLWQVMGMEELHDGAEKFDPKTETAFKFLQMFSACCVMFAHGAGEVGYMAGAWARLTHADCPSSHQPNICLVVGPLSVIWNIYNQPKLTSLPSSVSAEYWILVLSAASLVIGLATYGKRVTRVVGKELAKVCRALSFFRCFMPCPWGCSPFVSLVNSPVTCFATSRVSRSRRLAGSVPS